MPKAIFLDSFASGLDDLTRKQQRDYACVLRVLHSAGRFSVFEASDNSTIANTMTNLMKSDLVVNLGGSYPWTKVKLTAKGEALLYESNRAAASLAAQDGRG
jgi:hypothetical protein